MTDVVRWCARYLKLQDVGNVHNINLITPEQ
jgi:hypothetical protein